MCQDLIWLLVERQKHRTATKIKAVQYPVVKLHVAVNRPGPRM